MKTNQVLMGYGVLFNRHGYLYMSQNLYPFPEQAYESAAVSNTTVERPAGRIATVVKVYQELRSE
jgi:hypothetical protein